MGFVKHGVFQQQNWVNQHFFKYRYNGNEPGIIFMCIYIYVYMYICIYVYMYICIYVYMYICIYVYMYICIYVYMYICILHKQHYGFVQTRSMLQNRHVFFLEGSDRDSQVLVCSAFL